MRINIRLMLTLFVLNCHFVTAQNIEKTLTLSNEFTNVPGTPRIVLNTRQNLWLAIWRQNGSPATIQGRLIQKTGIMRAPKTLATNPSVSVHSFDVAFDPVHNRFLLLYEAPQGLVTQLLNATLGRLGTANPIESGAVQTVPRLIFNPTNNTFTAFWLSSRDGIARKAFKSRVLNTDGNPVGSERVLKEATDGFEFLAIASNAHEQSAMALLMQNKDSSAAVVGVNIQLDGTLSSAQTRTFQTFKNGLRSFGDLAFSTIQGSGMAFWIDGTITKFRRINSAGAISSPAKGIASSSDLNSVQPTIVFQEDENVFAGCWAVANQIRVVYIHPDTGAVLQQPFVIGTSLLLNSGNVAASYDHASQNTLVAWDDFSVSSSTTFQTRGVVFNNQ